MQIQLGRKPGMTLFDRIKTRGEEKGYSIAKIEELAGLSPNSLYKWKTQIPKIDKLKSIADLLDVSTDYLLGRTDKEHYYDLSENEKLDVAKEAERMLQGLETDSEVNYYGEPLDDDDRAKLKDALEIALSLTRVKAKKKFTPKKYRDDSEGK